MPPLTRYGIRLALLHLWLGFGLAALLLARKGQPTLISAEVWRWLPAHINLLLVGWMVQLALSVAYWIFPRLPFTLTERGRVPLAIAAFTLLNGGVWLHCAAVILATWTSDDLLIWQTLGLGLQIVGVLAFIAHILPRVRPTLVS